MALPRGLAVLLASMAPRPVVGVPCVPGDPVAAFYAGGVDLGDGQASQCTPEMEQCYFPGRIFSGPDAAGTYTVDWEDGDATNRHVAHARVRRSPEGEACDGPEPALSDEDDEGWVPPEIPCTVMPRLHWEGSDPEWNSEAIASLRREYQPDEVIDGFDWHVILRFHDVSRCEAALRSLEEAIQRCTEPDPEKCRTHKYVRAVEYVGDDPETRRRTGRHVYDPLQPQGKTEL